MLSRISMRHEKISIETKNRIVWSCGKLDKYCNKIVDCEVIIDKEKRGVRAEFIVSVPQNTITATGVGYNLYKAIAEGGKKAEGQLKKYHGKRCAH